MRNKLWLLIGFVVLAGIAAIGAAAIAGGWFESREIVLIDRDDVRIVEVRTGALLESFMSSGSSSTSSTREQGEYVEFEGQAFAALIADAFDVPAGGVEYEFTAPAWEYNVRVGSEAKPVPEVAPVLRDALREIWGIEGGIETREFECLRMLCPGGECRLDIHLDTSGGSGTTRRGNSAEFQNAEISHLAGIVQQVFDRKTFDESEIEGRFDLSLTWTSPSDFEAQLRELGFTLEPFTQELEVLVLSADPEKLAARGE